MSDKIFSIIISNRNDTAMLSVTVNSCIEELKSIGLDKCEIIICDNSDENIYQELNHCLPTGYIRDKILKISRQDFPCLFSARETAISHTSSNIICCLDSHMIVGHNMFLDLLNFIKSKEDDPTLGFAHAPLRWAHHHERNSVHDRDMSVSELGSWNKKYNEIRTITWKGMPWACTKEFWYSIKGYGALAKHRVSWGGGDMHIGIKPWLLGYKNWAVPTSSAIHIGPFPKINRKDDSSAACEGESNGYKYRLYGASGNFPHTFGFLVSCYIIGGEPMMERNRGLITEKFGRYLNVEKWWQKAMELGKDEKAWLDENKKLTFEQLLTQRPWDD